jgi:LPS export ABC transporter protein LptC
MTPTNGKHFTKTEVIDTPLLKVPPAARGEPCRGAVPPACRGNFKEGVSKTVHLCLILLALLLTGCQPARESAQSPPEPAPTQEGTTVNLPDATYEIVKPTLEQQDELGRTLWKLQAQALRAETRDSQAQGTLSQVRGWLYRNGKPVLEFTAPYARANAETREVEAWGSVVATSKTNDARLTAGRIVWQARRDRIRASEGVRLRWGDFELRERALHVDTALEKAWSVDN